MASAKKDFRVPLPPPKLPALVPGKVKEKKVKTQKEIKAEERQKEQESYRMKKMKLQDEKELEEENKAKRFTQTNYSSLDSNILDDQQRLFTYYCAYCGAFSLILDVDLNTLPRRQGGKGDYGLEESKHTYRTEMHEDLDVGVIKRTGGFEKQWRYKCGGCHLIGAYRTKHFDQKAKFLYILPDALADDPSVAKRKILKFQQEQEEIARKKALASMSNSSSSSSSSSSKKKKKKRVRGE